MNAMIRGLKGILALVALAGLGVGLRWMTAGSIGAANSHDLDSMAVLAVGTVAWMAYGWLVLAVLATVLEQIPGVIGAAASAVTGRITSQTSRTLLRSALGLAAVTPLTVGVAQATPGDGTIARPWTQLEPRSTVQPTSTPWRTTEPPSTVQLSGPAPYARPFGGTVSSGTPASTNRPTTEPPSTVRLTGPTPATDTSASRPQDVLREGTRPQDAVPTAQQRTTSQRGTAGTRSGQPAERSADSARTDVPADARTRRGVPSEARTQPGVPTDSATRGEVPGGARVRVGVPDRPTAGAATRYTDVRSGQPVRVPARVVVKPGDTLWSIAAKDLGPNATAEDIAARWPAWYAANRQLIGPGPT
ncbi:hypothetical protein EV652_107553 [Kribbella steppae]|uniref:LysM domain-containing protein n=1 Tax=Kribbella steppae TaxID=2512223 RepID=A0A4R2HEH2_9ACTN|nr:LysM peptidoglycan-binding domain-containing protein [Kribbella steppae]TCO26660.1 hypothetical protein EV652_107553 [Kribbella steppae]